MAKFLILYAVVLICGIIGGWYIALVRMGKHASDGVCIRSDDGEVYLRMSLSGQIKLSDPQTKYLLLRVVDVTTRNKHPL